MKLIEFSEQTLVIAKDQPEYIPMPAYKYANDKQGTTVFCWGLSWRERLKILFTGLLWHHVLTFNQPMQPQMLGTDKPEMPAPAPGNLVPVDFRTKKV